MKFKLIKSSYNQGRFDEIADRLVNDVFKDYRYPNGYIVEPEKILIDLDYYANTKYNHDKIENLDIDELLEVIRSYDLGEIKKLKDLNDKEVEFMCQLDGSFMYDIIENPNDVVVIPSINEGSI